MFAWQHLNLPMERKKEAKRGPKKASASSERERLGEDGGVGLEDTGADLLHPCGRGGGGAVPIDEKINYHGNLAR